MTDRPTLTDDEIRRRIECAPLLGEPAALDVWRPSDGRYLWTRVGLPDGAAGVVHRRRTVDRRYRWTAYLAPENPLGRFRAVRGTAPTVQEAMDAADRALLGAPDAD